MIRLLIQFAFVLNFNPQIPVLGFGADFLCARIPGLTAKQREICETAPDSLIAIGDGTRLGLAECQDQFRNSRWNCSTISSSVGHIAVVGSREAAFLYAISSAGVTYSIAQGCARGNVSTCGCAPPTTISTSVTSAALQSPSIIAGTNVTIIANRVFHEWNSIAGWKWGGCSVDILFATKLARIFLDSREIERDARSFMNMHNNKAGRKAVQNTLETQCKCHGVSGSCTLKTCWLRLPTFKHVGDLLMEKYNSAQHVFAVKSKISQRSQQGRKKRIQLYVKPKTKRARPWTSQYQDRDGFRRLRARSHEFAMLRAKMKRRVQRIRPKHTSLVYLEESPNYCEPDSLRAILGTKSRPCKRGVGHYTASQDEDGSCEILCCGRGYSTYEILRKWKCQCKFTWCCTVECSECEQLTEIYTCN